MYALRSHEIQNFVLTALLHNQFILNRTRPELYCAGRVVANRRLNVQADENYIRVNKCETFRMLKMTIMSIAACI